MTVLLCASPRCRSRDHAPDCGDHACRGCLPRRAADGLLLCWRCTDRIGDDARMLAELDAELALRLLGGGGGGGRVGGGTDDGRLPDPRAMAARAELRNVLTSWCRMVAEERGIRLPWRWALAPLPDGVQGPPARVRVTDDRLSAVAAYLGDHRRWLAAHPAAGECCDELANLRHRAWRVAYPDGARTFEVGPCPVDGCHGQIRAVLRRVDSLLPSALVCSEDDGHSIPADQWVRLGRQIRAIKEAAA